MNNTGLWRFCYYVHITYADFLLWLWHAFKGSFLHSWTRQRFFFFLIALSCRLFNYIFGSLYNNSYTELLKDIYRSHLWQKDKLVLVFIYFCFFNFNKFIFIVAQTFCHDHDYLHATGRYHLFNFKLGGIMCTFPHWTKTLILACFGMLLDILATLHTDNFLRLYMFSPDLAPFIPSERYVRVDLIWPMGLTEY